MWTDWRDCVCWAANEWSPGQIGQEDMWAILLIDFEIWLRQTFFIDRNRHDYNVQVTNYVNANLSRIEEWGLEWMISYGYGRRGYRER